MKTQIDHLVVAARTLDAGVAWCEATLGVTPGPGGEHALYGTHNRLLKIATPANPLASLEIIAINPDAPARPVGAGKRWFDLDDAALQSGLADQPRLVHFVASTDDIARAVDALHGLGIDRGAVVSASRQSPKGLLQWQITVRADGRRLFDGGLPSLIQWGKPGDSDPLRLHPRNSLPRSRVSLKHLSVQHPEAQLLQAGCQVIGLGGVSIRSGPAELVAALQTPKGLVTLHSGAA